MKNYLNVFFSAYLKSVESIFYVFLFLVLSFGRAFSIQHLSIGSFPFYATELILLLLLPYIVLRYKSLSLPVVLKRGLCLFVGQCFLYFIIAVVLGRDFALRDIVLFVYILFFAYLVLLLKDIFSFKKILLVVLFANLVNLFIGRFYALGYFPSLTSQVFITSIKPTNLGLFYGILISFLFSFFCITLQRSRRIAILIFLVANLYMVFTVGTRTSWVAIFLMLFFLCFVFRIYLKSCWVLLSTGILVGFLLLGFFDFGVYSSPQIVRIVSKMKSLSPVLLIKQIVYSEEIIFVKVRKMAVAGEKDEEVRSAMLTESVGNIVWRFDIWKQAVRFGLQSPLLGRGFGVYPPYEIWDHPSPPPKNIGVDSGVIPTHNHLVSIFYKLGLFGLSLFIFINFYVFWYGMNHLNACRSKFLKTFLIASLGAFICWHVMALFFDIIDSPSTSVFLWILAGLIVGSVEADRKSPNLGHLKK